MGFQAHRAPNFFDSEGSDRAYEGFITSLRGLGQDREDRRKADLAAKRQQAQEDFMRAQSEAAERRQQAADDRERRKYELDISERNRKQAGELYDTAVDRPTRAAALARASVYVDPKTGEQRSVDFDPGGVETHTEMDPLQLQEPGAQPPPKPYGGIASMLRLHPPGAPSEQPPAAGGEEEAMGGQPSGMQPRPPAGPVEPPPVGEANGAPPPSPYGGLTSSLKLAPTPPQMRTTTTVRKPSLGLPGGGRQEIDTDEARAHKLQDAADTADRLVSQASAEPDPVKRDGMLAEARRIRASLPGASAAGLRTEALQESGQTFKAKEGAADRASREKIAAMRKAGAGGATGSGFKERALNEREFNNWADKAGVKALIPMERSLDQAAHNLESDTPLAHRDSAIQIARFARGTTPTEGEQKFLYDAIQHSIAAWPDSMIARFKNGDLGDDMIKNLADAVKQGRAAYAQFRERVLNSGKIGLHTDTNKNLQDKVAAVGVTLGMTEQASRAQLGNKDAARAQMVQDKLLQHAKDHPEDPRSAAILRKFGGTNAAH